MQTSLEWCRDRNSTAAAAPPSTDYSSATAVHPAGNTPEKYVTVPVAGHPCFDHGPHSPDERCDRNCRTLRATHARNVQNPVATYQPDDRSDIDRNFPLSFRES